MAFRPHHHDGRGVCDERGVVTAAELRTLGNKHGRGWQTRLARQLEVNPRTVRRWLAGKHVIKPVIARRIRELLK